MDRIALVADIVSGLILGGVLAHGLMRARHYLPPPFEQATADDSPFVHRNHSQSPLEATISIARLRPNHEFQPVLADADCLDSDFGDLPQDRRHGLG